MQMIKSPKNQMVQLFMLEYDTHSSLLINNSWEPYLHVR